MWGSPSGLLWGSDGDVLIDKRVARYVDTPDVRHVRWRSVRMRIPLTRIALTLCICAIVAGCHRLDPDAASTDRGEDLELPADSEMIPGRVPASATLAGMLTPHSLHTADVTGVVTAAARRSRRGSRSRGSIRCCTGCGHTWVLITALRWGLLWWLSRAVW
jgi:hypothetical protein